MSNTAGRLLAPLALILALLVPGVGRAANEFVIQALECRLEEGIFVLDAQIDYRFSEVALEALANGVPLFTQVQLKLRRQNAWVWEKDYHTTQIRYRLQYQAVAALYRVDEFHKDTWRDFATLEGALEALGTIKSLPVVPQKLLEAGESYEVGIKTALDVDALPLPLRPIAYMSPSWSMSSDWRSCVIRP